MKKLLTLLIIICFIFIGFYLNKKDSFVLAADKTTLSHSWSNTEFLNKVNKERSSRSLKDLKENTELNRLAEERLRDMISSNYFSHDSPNKKDIDSLLFKSSYSYQVRGENLAYGDFSDESDVMNSWMKSKWHRYNILYPSFEEVGTASIVANYMGGKYLVVVQVFGKEKLNSEKEKLGNKKESLESRKSKLNKSFAKK